MRPTAKGVKGMLTVALTNTSGWTIVLKDAALWTIILGVLFLAAVTYALINISRFNPVHGRDEFKSSRAIVTEDLDPEGRVMVQGEIWRACSKNGEVIPRGHRVKVLGREGMNLVVEPIPSGDRKMMGGKMDA
jgi:membrane-bound serine protease (ClpP class)